MASLADLRWRAFVRMRLAVQATGYDVVREPFRHRFLPAMAQHSVRTVLDVGANRGQFGTELRRCRFTGRLISVEPLSEPFAALSAIAAADGNWHVERAAVAAEPGSVTVNVSKNSASSSILPILERSVHAAPQTQYVSTEQVDATTVDELVARHELDPGTTLLKIDVQGFESAVLDGAAKTLSQFGGVRLEMSLVPLYDGEALMPEMTARLNDAGFDLWFVEPGFSEPDTHRLLQLDGVFFPRAEDGR
jgi:FkbM family methyltransferase